MNYYSNLNWTVREINYNFLIKVYGVDAEGNKINKLLGVWGIVKLIGQEMFNKLLKRAFRDMRYADKIVCKLRRGLKITFYCH